MVLYIDMKVYIIVNKNYVCVKNLYVLNLFIVDVDPNQFKLPL